MHTRVTRIHYSEHGGRRETRGEQGKLAFYGCCKRSIFFVTLACWIRGEVLVDGKTEIMHAYVYMN